MAIYLAQDRGFDVDVFEASGEEKMSGPTVRSWNVVISKRGIKALSAAGVDLIKEVGDQQLSCTTSMRSLEGFHYCCSGGTVVIVYYCPYPY